MTRRLALFAALVALPASAGAVTASLTPEQKAPGFLQIVERISPHVHMLRQAETFFFDGVGNITVVEQSDGLVLVDSGGLFGSGHRAIRLIRSISPKPVKAIVITHWHSDHNLGLSAMIRMWPKMQIIAHEATIRAMLEGRPPGVPRAPSKEFEAKRAASYTNSFARAREQELAKPSSPIEHAALERELATLDIRIADLAGTFTVIPNRGFKHRLRIADPVAPVDILFLGRANTSGDTLLWIPRDRVLATGDVVDQPIPFMFDVYPSEMLRVFDRIRALKPRTLIPGHGHAVPLDYLDRVARLVRLVQRQVTPLARRNLSLEEVRKQAHFAATNEFDGADPWLQSYFQQYALDPLIDSVYREARGDPLGPPPVTGRGAGTAAR